MLKKILIFAAVILLGTGIYMALPLVYNPAPDSQTELVRRDLFQTEINNEWPGPAPHDRTRARVILLDEEVIFEDGPTDMIMNTHSMRKSFLSLLYGIAVEKGLVDLGKTLGEMGIDETTPLTDQEKTATILDLLMFRSGIYIPAEGEHDSQITDRPARDSHIPGTYFFSNNFDANTLGTIFVQETGYEIGAFMEEFLARPLGMQDFTADNVVMGGPWFMPNNGSMHPMYNMYLSARDTARIGAMLAQEGVWNGVQVVPADWISASTTSYSNIKDRDTTMDGFGYIWWLYTAPKLVRTDGYGEHLMIINPALNLTLVERNFTGNSYLSTGRWMFMGDNKFSNSFDGLFKTQALLANLLSRPQE